jgi:hypothetical protein
VSVGISKSIIETQSPKAIAEETRKSKKEIWK